MKPCNFKTSMFFLLFFASLAIYSCKQVPPKESVIYTEAEDFNLTAEVSEEFGYDSILISKGEYPITFDKNKNGQLSLKVLEKYGEGNELRTIIKPWRGRRKYNPKTGLYCIGWGFSCHPKLYVDRTIRCKFTFTNEDLLLIEFLDKVPFGEEEFENQ